MNPRVSIVTVTKNCVATIAETLESVEKVKNEEIEYIVIDGASVDGTKDVIKTYASIVDVFVSEPDTGIYNAMNKGVERSRGKYIVFINGDDRIVPDGFLEIMEKMRGESFDIVCGATHAEKHDASIENLIARPWHLFFYNSIPHPSTFIRRDWLERFPYCEGLKIASDYKFFLTVYMNGASFKSHSAVTAFHRRGGVSGNVEGSLLELDLVRRRCLGLWYPLTNLLMRTYRVIRRLRR